MTAPALSALKRGAVDREVVLLTSKSGAEAGRLLADVDGTISYAAPWMKTMRAVDAAPDLELIAQLAEGHYDAAVIFTVYSQSALAAALACHLAGIPLRLARARENPYLLLTDWVRETEPHDELVHEVDRQRSLVARPGVGLEPERPAPLLRIPASAASEARTLLQRLGVRRERPWVVVHPGASAASRRYPAASFTAVVSQLAALGWQVVLTGGEDERDLTREIVRGSRSSMVLDAAGELSFAGLAALLRDAPMLLSNNTGPVHIASAVGTPVVVLYALTNPQHTPWGVPSRVLYHDVPCAFCYSSVCPEGHHACLREVSPDAIVLAVLDLQAEVGRRALAG